MAENNCLTLKIITPSRVFYEGEAEMVELNTSEGEIGVLPGHLPMTVIVKPGVLTITEPEGEKEAALHAGFAEILPDRVTILAEMMPPGRKLRRSVPKSAFMNMPATRI